MKRRWNWAIILVAFLVGSCSDPEPRNIQNPGSGAVASPGQADAASFDQAQVEKDFRGIDLKVLDVSERERNGRNALAVTLSVPIDPAINHASYLNVENKETGLVDGSWIVSDSGKILWFPHTEPNTEYVVTIYPGLTAGNNTQLANVVSTEVRTRDLKSVVNFNTSGAFLSAGVGGGLPITAVNIAAVDIDFFKIEQDQVGAFLDQMRRSQGYYYDISWLKSYADLVYSGRYDLDAAKNTRVVRNIDVSDIETLKEPGLYLAVMLAAGEYQSKQLLTFSVTDLGLHARQYQQQLDVHVSSLRSGKPLKGVKVSLLDSESKTLAERVTSPDGLASFSAPQGQKGNDVKLIVAEWEHHYSVIETRDPGLDLSEFNIGQRPQLPVELFVYTPRDLFRPGELIDFSGLLRDGDGRETRPAVLSAEVKRPDGTVAKSFKWQPERLAYYHYAWRIPNDAPVGNWELVVSGPLQQPVVYPFKVEEFLPERMKLTFQAEDAQRLTASANESLRVPVLGEYLYGAPASGNRLSTIVSIKPWRTPIESLPGFEFGDVNEQGLKQRFNLQDIHLNAQGKGEIVVESKWRSVRSPLMVNLISSLYETGGRPVSRINESLIWPTEAMIGIKPGFGDANPDANSRVRFDIVKANLSGDQLAAKDLQVRLIREDRQYFWVHDSFRGWHYQWSDKEFEEISQSVAIEAGQSLSVEYPVDYGNYRLEVYDANDDLRSSLRFFAGYDWYNAWEDSQAAGQVRPDKVNIALNQPSYRAGEVAEVVILPPEGGEALVMVEGDSPLWMQRVSIPADGVKLEIPIDESWQRHNLYVTATVLKPAQEGDKAGETSRTPKRSFGITHLPLNRDERALVVDINTPEKILPNQTFNTEISVADDRVGGDASGPMMLTLAAVDVGVLSVSNFQSPDPLEAFFGQRRYAVESQDMYDKLIDVSSAERAQLRFGGDADLNRGGSQPPSDVQIVSLFSGLIDVKEGRATVPLQIPDFNGRLRLMAVAFSAERFGHAEQEMTVAAPVVTQLAMPRFLAQGDQATIALDINNLSGEAKSIEVSMQSAGPIEIVSNNSNKAKVLVLENQEKTTLKYRVRASGHTGEGEFVLNLTGDGIKPIERRWRLGLRPAYPALIQERTSLLGTNEQFQLGQQDISGLMLDTVTVQLSASPNADLNLSGQLQNLLDYPYGCLEQTSSRAFPLIFASQANQRRFALKSIEDGKRQQMINEAIDRLAAMQLSNGGFGLWSNRSPEEHWLTAFVVDLLLSARERGAAVPEGVVDKSMQRLSTYLNRSGRFVGERWSEDDQHYTFAYKAYSAYVLSRVNQAPLGTLRNLFDRQLNDARSGLPQVHLGLALLKMGDQRRGTEAIAAALDNIPSTGVYLGDYGSDIRDLALMIYLLLENEQQVSRAYELSFELAERLKARHWLSTQERNSLFLAGIALETRRSDSWQAKLFLGASEKSISQQQAYRTTFSGDQVAAGISLQSEHDNALFVRASISGYATDKPEPESRGLTIHRSWYNLDGREITPSSVKVGDMLIVRLEASADTHTPDALIVDLLPAGLELENQNLENAVKLDTLKLEGQDFASLKRFTQSKHTEYREDRFVSALDLSRGRRANVFYLVRAVNPGVYRVPPPLIEDMYRPERRGVGETFDVIQVQDVDG